MEEAERRRIWIGNLDEKITEYQLLKLIQKHGKIKKFDLLFHRTGPRAGKSRGYAFVTFEKCIDATNALHRLNGFQLASKCISVKWADSMKELEDEKYKSIPKLSALVGVKETEPCHSQSAKIQAIERKLKMMEQKSDLEQQLLLKSVPKKPKTEFSDLKKT